MKEKCLIQGKVLYLTSQEQDCIRKEYEEKYGMEFYPTSDKDKERISKAFTPLVPTTDPTIHWNPYPQYKPTRKDEYLCSKKDGSVKVHAYNPKSGMFSNADKFVSAWAELPTRSPL